MRIGTIEVDGNIVGTIDVRVTRVDLGIVPEYAPDSFGFHGFPDPGTEEEDGAGPPSLGPSFEPEKGTRGPKTQPDGNRPEEKPEKSPTFRRGIGPGSVNHPLEHLGGKSPAHLTTTDVKSAVEGGGRSKFREEIARNPALREKILNIMYNEQGKHPEGTQAIAESMMNRAVVRGTNLERQARWYKGEPGGYYERGNMGRGKEPHRAVLEAALERALASGNVSNYATDNSSGGLARREIRQGRFEYRREIHGETFSVPTAREQPANRRAWEEWMRRGAPIGGGDAARTVVPIERARHAPERLADQQQPTFANQPIRSAIERDRRADTFADRPRPGGQPGAPDHVATGRPNEGDLDYLAAHGAHSTVLRGGRMVSGRPGEGTHVNPEFVRRMAAAGREYTRQTGLEPRYGEMDRPADVQAVYYQRYLHGGGLAAAPGRSRHQHGEATDVPRGPFLDWLHRHGSEHGIFFPVLRRDPVHAQLDPRFRGGPAPARAEPPAAAIPPAARPVPPGTVPTTTPATPSATRGTMLFLHGMQSRYGGTSPATVEAQARRYAEARNMNLEVIDVSGDERRRQIAAAQARINRGGVSTVLGFSAGGYATQHLRGVQERIAVGAPGVAHNVRLPGRHMEQVEQLARTGERTARHD